MSLWRRLLRSWVVFRAWLLRRPLPYGAVTVEELPDELSARTLYVIGEKGYMWFAAMLCPCGCGATIQLNMLPEARPRWKLTEHRDGTPSLHPSVWWLKGCRSHFFLRRGLIIWCRDEAE